MKKQRSENLLIGSMLFGLFFGAGNLIFPVHLGQEAGLHVVKATLGFLITATGFPFLGVLAMALTSSEDIVQLGSRVSKGYGYFLQVLLFLTIGPLFALPRTATVSFEVGLTPLLEPHQIRPALLIFAVVFFGVALFFALRPAEIVNWVGKVLNPLFLIFIFYLIIKAVITPMGSVANMEPVGAYNSSPLITGFIGGYQTMDALAALAFSGLVINAIRSFGTTEPKEIAKRTAKSGAVSVLLMCIVYSGLAWLGATSVAAFPVSANGGIALGQISRYYLGEFGSIFLAITITVACLKTAIGLISSCANAFQTMFPKTFSFRAYCVIFAVFSTVVANVGLTQIIALAMPMLMFIYPLAITLVLLALFERFFNKSRIVYRCVTIGALIVGIGDSLKAMPAFISSTAVVEGIVSLYSRFIPLFDDGLGWVIPSLIGLVIGLILSKVLPQEKANQV